MNGRRWQPEPMRHVALSMLLERRQWQARSRREVYVPAPAVSYVAPASVS